MCWAGLNSVNSNLKKFKNKTRKENIDKKNQVNDDKMNWIIR